MPWADNACIQVFKPLLDAEESDWDRVIATNLKGCFLCTQRAGRHMKERRSGAIVNIGSGCNKVPFPGSGYTARSGSSPNPAVMNLGPFGIRVNCVPPGADVDTERTKASFRLRIFLGPPHSTSPHWHSRMLRRCGIPAQRKRFLHQRPTASGVDGALLLNPAGRLPLRRLKKISQHFSCELSGQSTIRAALVVFFLTTSLSFVLHCPTNERGSNEVGKGREAGADLEAIGR